VKCDGWKPNQTFVTYAFIIYNASDENNFYRFFFSRPWCAAGFFGGSHRKMLSSTATEQFSEILS